MLRRSFLRFLGLAPVAAPMAVAAATAPAVRSLGVGTLVFDEIALAPGAYGMVGLSDPGLAGMSAEIAEGIGGMRRALAANGVEATHLIGPTEMIHPYAIGDAEPSYLDLYAPEHLNPEGE